MEALKLESKAQPFPDETPEEREEFERLMRNQLNNKKQLIEFNLKNCIGERVALYGGGVEFVTLHSDAWRNEQGQNVIRVSGHKEPVFLNRIRTLDKILVGES
ncbi:hypothetical protein [Algicola sagamiensis]|uniref:hypothetical protein n=1 Tax=Algicola sagamiensis TaxID=163869 RepID=UPI00037EB6D6|nr:hypothetical protein [Algicola sagamiensis]